MRFYLGTHQVCWLGRLTDVPLFVSRRRLQQLKSLPVATTPWALDSGGFTELDTYGGWRIGPEPYVDAVRDYAARIGRMEWASPQDWMCEPHIVAKTGLTVDGHQGRTVDNYTELAAAGPEVNWTPVLQGWDLADYHRCADRYAAAGVDLAAAPLVGVGSVCRRQGQESIAAIFASLADRGLRLHGFGVKTQGLRLSTHLLASADSLAWSYRARMAARDGERHPGCTHATCANCMKFALRWRDQLLAAP